MCMAVLHPCMSVQHTCVPGVCEGKKAPDSLKVELQVVVSPLCVLGIQSWLKSIQCFYTLSISTASVGLVFYSLLIFAIKTKQENSTARVEDHSPYFYLLFYHCIISFFSIHVHSAR